MKKLLFCLILCAGSPSIKAMDRESVAPIGIYGGNNVPELSRQSFKDYSSLDVAYATVLQETIAPEEKDVLNGVKVSALINANIGVARVITSQGVRYCNGQELDIKLGLQRQLLPKLLASEKILQIDYYHPIACNACAACQHAYSKWQESFKAIKSYIKQEHFSPEEFFKRAKQVLDCDKSCANKQLMHSASYQDREQYCKLFFEEDPQGENRKKIAQLFASAQDVSTKLTLLACITAFSSEKNTAHINAGQYDAALKEMEISSDGIEAFCAWIEKTSDRRTHPVCGIGTKNFLQLRAMETVIIPAIIKQADIARKKGALAEKEFWSAGLKSGVFSAQDQ